MQKRETFLLFLNSQLNYPREIESETVGLNFEALRVSV